MSSRSTAALLCLFALQAPGDAGPDRFLAGVAAYRAGRYEESRVAFASELAARGADAPAALRANLAMAALRVQRTQDAEAAARPLLESAVLDDRAWGEFLCAFASFQRGERAAAAARLPDAEPMAWETAVRSVAAAVQGWCRANELRAGWPEALRNAERAVRRLAALERERAAAAPQQQKRTEPVPPEPPPLRAQPSTEEVQPDLVQAKLSAAELERLRQRLRQVALEKQRTRLLQPRSALVAGERDW
jgi:hypothetical protein